MMVVPLARSYSSLSYPPPSAQHTLSDMRIESVSKSSDANHKLTSRTEYYPSRLSTSSPATRSWQRLLQHHSRSATYSNARSMSRSRLFGIIIHVSPSRERPISETHIRRHTCRCDNFRLNAECDGQFDNAWIDPVGSMSCDDLQRRHTLACKALQ
jgi:hypothetical protein